MILIEELSLKLAKFDDIFIFHYEIARVNKIQLSETEDNIAFSFFLLPRFY